jgi:hypothetical protein
VDWARATARFSKQNLLMMITLSVIPSMVALAFRHSWLADFQPQGRYMFAALIPFLYVVTIGWRELGSTSWRKDALSLMLVGSVGLLNIGSLYSTLLPGHGMSLSQWWGEWQGALVAAWILAGLACGAWYVLAIARGARQAIEPSPLAASSDEAE